MFFAIKLYLHLNCVLILKWIVWNRFILIKMDSGLNSLHWLIFYKIQPINHLSIYVSVRAYLSIYLSGRAKAGRPARTYIKQLCEDTRCSLEDLPEAMNNREKGRERVKDIRASGMTWWWLPLRKTGIQSPDYSIIRFLKLLMVRYPNYP